MKRVTVERAVLMARELHAEGSDDDIEVDFTMPNRGTQFSQSADGCWVAGWLWVPGIRVEETGRYEG